jgi:serine/threonine protein kinase
MTSLIGKTISHYKILEKLGEGGMGVVYKAEDTKLRRPAALKFLHQSAVKNKARKSQLLQEAMAAASINHPNICTVYEINEVGEHFFITMEYIAGYNLKAMIQSGSLEVEKIVDIASQIAEGIQEIHQKDMIHGDIKSDNVRITEKGMAKIMDFGLAKPSHIKHKMDAESSTGGTIAYMSPEQIRGEKLDHRTDIWSWGVVLYEMLTGALPFKTDQGLSGLYSILNDQPESVQKVRPELSIKWINLLNRAMEKDRENRYQSIQEVLNDLKDLRKDGSEPDYSSDAAHLVGQITRKKNIIRLLAPAVFLSVLVLIIVSVREFLLSKPEAKVIRLTSLTDAEYDPALSPDGSKLAFCWNEELNYCWDIYINLIGETDSYPLTSSTERDYSVAWSADGNSVAFIREGREEMSIYRKSIISGKELKLYTFHCGIDMEDARPEIDWSADGRWIVFSDVDSSERKLCLFQLNVKTFEKEQLTFPGPGHIGDMTAKYSPDGKAIAFERLVSYNVGDLHVLELENRQIRQISFDRKNIEGLDWTPDSRQIVFSSNRDGFLKLYRISANGGQPKQLKNSGKNVTALSLSTSGSRLAYSERRFDLDVYRVDIPDSYSEEIKPCRLTGSSQTEGFPVFSPDEDRFVFSSNRTGNWEIWACKSDGSDPVRITSLNANSNVPQWSPDGRWIVFDSDIHGPRDILMIDAQGMKSPQMLITDSADDRIPTWSHDGEWVYFGSNRTGEFQIYKTHVQTRELVQVTQNGGMFGRESRDGKWLYFKKHDDPNGPIYRLDLMTNKESIAIHENVVDFRWDTSEEGIVYYVADQNRNHVIKRYRASSETIERLGIIKDPSISDGDLSRDGRSMLVVSGYDSGDIYLIENFR